MNKLLAIIRLRCPRCATGPIFASLFRMNPRCPVCGLEFEREQGYFVGAMYFSYALALAAVLPVIVAMLLLGFGAAPIYVASCLLLVVLSPFLFRYSRVIWIHLDQVIDPQPRHSRESGKPGMGRGPTRRLP